MMNADHEVLVLLHGHPHSAYDTYLRILNTTRRAARHSAIRSVLVFDGYRVALWLCGAVEAVARTTEDSLQLADHAKVLACRPALTGVHPIALQRSGFCEAEWLDRLADIAGQEPTTLFPFFWEILEQADLSEWFGSS